LLLLVAALEKVDGLGLAVRVEAEVDDLLAGGALDESELVTLDNHLEAFQLLLRGLLAADLGEDDPPGPLHAFLVVSASGSSREQRPGEEGCKGHERPHQ